MTVIEMPTHILTSLFPPERVREVIRPRSEWRPCPTARDRAGWEALSDPVRASLIAAAEDRRGLSWPELPATLFLDFVRDGNRGRYEDRHFARRDALRALVLGECAEGRGRFLDDIVNGVWALCEESFWGVPAHSFSARPPFGDEHSTTHTQLLGLPDTAYHVIDLFAAETGALLAWTWYLLKEQLATTLPVVVDRIEREIQERILIPYRAVDTWGWLGKTRPHPNNWNPWIHSNVLATNLLVEPDAAKRAQTVSRIVEGLDAFLAGYHADGGCDEGTSYWDRAGGSLFDCLDLLYGASKGALDAFDLPLIQEIGRYIMRMHISGSWYVNFADGAAEIAPDGDLIYRYGRRIKDTLLMRQGAYIMRTFASDPTIGTVDGSTSMRDRMLIGLVRQRRGSSGSLGRLLPALFDSGEPAMADATPPLIRDAWLDGIQVLTARERAGTADGLFLAAKGGHNAESHNHNDVGQFIVAVDGEPVLIDIGVETYTRQTFGPERYTIWTMRGSYHNLPLINGVEQAAGREYAARDVACTVTDDTAELTLDLADAYPTAAGVVAWRRTVRLERGELGRITLEDVYRLRARPHALALHLMARADVDIDTPGVLRCSGPTRVFTIHYDAQEFTPSVERIPIEDARLGPVWGDRIFRIILTVRDPQSNGHWDLTMTAD